jgi:hypothetical protein
MLVEIKLTSRSGICRLATPLGRVLSSAALAVSAAPSVRPLAVSPNTLAINTPSKAAIMVVTSNTPTTVPPILPRVRISSTFRTEAIIVISTSGIMISFSRLT